MIKVTKDVKKWLKESIAHWKENYDVVRDGFKKGVAMDNWVHHICKVKCMAVGDRCVWYDNSHCSLCRNIGYCAKCPIFRDGHGCDGSKGVWLDVCMSRSTEEIMESVKKMYKYLVELNKRCEVVDKKCKVVMCGLNRKRNG